MRVPQSVLDSLKNRQENGRMRSFSSNLSSKVVDFSSNDYLNISSCMDIVNSIDALYKAQLDKHRFKIGSSGSRLLSGNHEFYEQVEKYLAAYYKRESSLLYNSGYIANLSVMSSLPMEDDVVLFDEMVHYSIRHGIESSRGIGVAFKHNDVVDLKSKIRNKGSVYIVVESVYSMDGDVAPLIEMVALTKQYENCYLIVDEAHSSGCFGRHGEGLVNELGLSNQVFCTIHTFGKALGCHGAIATGSKWLISYLINYSRPFIYSTSMALHQLCEIKTVHQYCYRMDKERTHLKMLIHKFQDAARHAGLNILPSTTCIQGILFPGNHHCIEIAKRIISQGYHVLPIRAPTVPSGTERIRIILHANHTIQHIQGLIQAVLQTQKSKL